MKKKIILGVVAVVVVALVVAAVVLTKVPALNMDGTYVAKDGTTLTISGDTFTCTDAPYSGNVERVNHAVDYIPYNLPQSEGTYLCIYVGGTLKTADNEYDIILAEDGNQKYVQIWLSKTEFVEYFPG